MDLSTKGRWRGEGTVFPVSADDPDLLLTRRVHEVLVVPVDLCEDFADHLARLERRHLVIAIRRREGLGEGAVEGLESGDAV